jgi:type I restriction enzyme S subunit
VGDFVIAMDRTWVNSGLKASSITECDVPSLLVQRVARIRCLDDLHNGYLSSLIRSHRFEQYVKGVQTETAIPHISPDQIRELSVSLPPLPEQKAIADTLSTWDAAIEMTERLIASKERWISGFGKQLFRRGRENSSSGWKTVALHEVLHEHGDVSTGNESVYSVSVHKGLVDQIEHLGRSFAAANTSNYNRVHFGDVVYTKSPTGDFPLGIFKQSTVDMDVIVSPLYGVFTPQTFELGVILDFFFSSPVNAKNYLNPLIQKGAKNTINITNTTFLRGQICLPMDPGEQKKMCDLIQATRDEILTLQSILDKLKLQKRGLMQKLLTGTWRVPVRNKVAS